LLSENLKKAREEKNWSQQKVGDAVGVTQVAIHHFETGLKVPQLATMIALSNVLGKSIDELVK
jgi:transcriptional regulator with XRE-family HTH domain